MEKETETTQREILTALQDGLDLNVTEVNLCEYWTGDPTRPDSECSGAEIKVTAYVSYETEGDDENPYKVK